MAQRPALVASYDAQLVRLGLYSSPKPTGEASGLEEVGRGEEYIIIIIIRVKAFKNWEEVKHNLMDYFTKKKWVSINV